MQSNNPILSPFDLALIKELSASDISDSSLPIIRITNFTKQNNDIKKILSLFIENKKRNEVSQIKLSYQAYGEAPVFLDQNSFNDEKHLVSNLHNFITENKYTSIDPKKFSSLLTTLNQLGMPIDINAWSKILYTNIDRTLRYSFNEFIDNINFLSKLANDSEWLKKLLPELLLHLIKEKEGMMAKQFEKINNLVSVYFPLIKETNGHPYFYIHKAIKYKNNNVQILLDILENSTPPYDHKGNSLLHVCHSTHLDKALKHTPNINHQNHKGNTALHLAAMEGNLDKIRFLLLHGANTEIKNGNGQTFWSISLESKNHNLNLYKLYKKLGNVLKIPPAIIEQQGLNCGFYAVECAASYHRAWQPELFIKPPLPARKRDINPKASSSLRQLREELEIPGKGPIFTVSDMQKVIEKTECKSVICDITSFDNFISIIKKAIDQNLPIIIPFSSDEGGREGNPHPSPTASTAHWATIIGWSSKDETKGILLAQYGQYYDTKADELFKAFYEIDAKFPETILIKQKGEDWDWNTSETDTKSSEDTQIHKIPLTSLDNFWKKLVIVLPPKYDETLLLKLNSTEASTNKKTL